MPGRVMYLVRSWPRLSQTFVVNEVLAQERLGTRLELYSLTRSEERLVQPQVSAVRAQVHYLDERPRRPRFAALREHALVARSAPLAYAATVVYAAARPQLSRGYATLSTLGCLAAAVRVAAAVHRARRAGDPVEHLHAHFAHDPALVALLTSRMTGVPYSVTAHARDLYQIPVPSLRARARAAVAVVTCCAANVDYLRSVLPADLHTRLRLIHHGVELDRFVPADRPDAPPPVRIVSVGRLVEKKGFADLLHACAELRSSRPEAAFRLRVLGDGPLRPELAGLRDRLGLREAVEFAGEVDRDGVLRAYQDADVFALTPWVPADGDRDGVPNVVVEAMACGLPVVTTDAGGVTEVVEHGRTGLVATPRDVGAIAGHLAELVTDPTRRRELGAAGRRRVEQGFDVRSAASELSAVFAGAAS
ncbi:glycosyltransferase [Geodermatophilus sp. YIM 151500]|uniref:glycosyltransferase n=1 Tax=Geodermatophilus sp. YIM 151500 TaxID=2984531 RepID=UPI0021E37AC9|nr:glycosyltransferase [Geodermatophilus sp. YIM 151500]MCV2491799.1 glycosyltransferase [Geodermatophilus sp. YIM 151500]